MRQGIYSLANGLANGRTGGWLGVNSFSRNGVVEVRLEPGAGKWAFDMGKRVGLLLGRGGH